MILYIVFLLRLLIFEFQSKRSYFVSQLMFYLCFTFKMLYIAVSADTPNF
jgi:hypothetical protein